MDSTVGSDGPVDRLDQLRRACADPFVAIDAAGAVTAWNPAAERVFGRPPAAALGRDLVDLVVPAPYRDAARRQLAAPGTRVEVVARAADGTEFPVEASIWTAGGEHHLLLRDLGERRRADDERTFTDASERRRAEQRLRAAFEHERAALAKLTELDEAKSNFLATISHELRTPLTNLVGYLELLRDGDLGEIGDEQRRALSAMGRNAERLRGMIEDLLTVAYMESRPLRLRLSTTDLASLVADVCANTATAARERGHRLEIDLDARVGALPADGLQLRRVLASLLDNAVKCTLPGGVIRVRMRPGPGTVEISVHDTGIGIDADELPRLFTRFSRTSAAAQLAIQGAGLSLAIARQIVEGHGGSIAVESAPGVGSTFTVRLPLEPALRQAA